MTLNCIGQCHRCKKPNARDDNKLCDNCVFKIHQYYIDNQESVKLYAKEYKLKNKDALAASNKIYKIAYTQISIECIICGTSIKQCKKSRHDKSKMHLSKLTTPERIETIDNTTK